ncbi:MAG: hypothetical protein QME28_10240 [Candidatus Saccharicenans sp.]|nr:hypothetical protein [Candidatus Saccharicenans sp.]
MTNVEEDVPEKQGLKLIGLVVGEELQKVEEDLPEKQGLKLQHVRRI